MRVAAFARFILIAIFVAWPLAAVAGGHNPADYPLRVHVYQVSGRLHYSGGQQTLDFADGEGRANLFEQGLPKSFDFSYNCASQVKSSFEFETYYARWKKQGVVLDVLLPVMGKSNAYNTCELKVAIKPEMAYHVHNGTLLEEPALHYKEWMDRVQYDPEHGKNNPQPEPKLSQVKPQQ